MDLAEDIVQDAMLAASRSWHTFRGDSEFRTWLFRIVIHAHRDRVVKGRQSVPFPDDVETGAAAGRPPLAEASEEMKQAVAGACRQIADRGVAEAVSRAMLRYLRLDAARSNELDSGEDPSKGERK